MLLIYGRPGEPASLLVEDSCYSTDRETQYRVVNGGYYLQPVTDGSIDHMRIHEMHTRWNNRDGRAMLRKDDPVLDNYVTLTMEWGHTLKPSDLKRLGMIPKGQRWGYDEVLDVARQLLAAHAVGPMLSVAERHEQDAIERNPPPQDWDPEAFA